MCLEQDRDAFVAAVQGHGYSRADAEEFGQIVTSLVCWSLEHDWGLQHTPRGDQAQAVVKFTIPGMRAPFWTAYPRQSDGAKLSAVDSAHVFPERVQAEARRVLAELDGREPEPNEYPTVSFQRLRSATTLRRVKQLFCWLLIEMDRHVETVASEGSRV